MNGLVSCEISGMLYDKKSSNKMVQTNKSKGDDFENNLKLISQILPLISSNEHISVTNNNK